MRKLEILDYGKIPPQAIELEELLLGTLMIESYLYDQIPEIKAEIFYKEANRQIFNAIQLLYDQKKPVDILTVTEKLKETKHIDECGGAIYVTSLTSKIASGSHFQYHKQIVIEKYILRLIIQKTSEIQNNCFADEFDQATELVNDLYKSVNSEIDIEMSVDKFNDLVTESKDQATIKMNNREKGIKPGIPIPIGKLQDIIGGWQKGDLIYIAARPSMGKTAVSLKFAKHSAKNNFRTLFFSLEMTKISLTDRMILGETEICPDRWKNGELFEHDFQEIEIAQSKIRNWPLFIIDKSAIKTDHVRSICKKMKPDIIIIDYIQLMTANRNKKNDNRNIELGSISHDLKSIAKDFNIPVIAISQLNRNIDSRGSKIPTLSDLRDSGELEQDADLIIFPFRPFVYDENPENKGIIEYIIAKHRSGQTGVIKGRHNQYMNDFYDYETDKNQEFNNNDLVYYTQSNAF